MPPKKKRKYTKKKNPDTGLKTLTKAALGRGWEGAKEDIATSLENTARQAINGLFDQALQRSMGSISSITGELMSGKKGVIKVESDWPDYLMKIIAGEYGVITIVGSRDTGKTTVAVNIAETRQKALNTPIYFINYPAQLAPKHITPIHGDQIIQLMEQAEFGSTIIVDDASLLLNSKRGMTGTGIAFENLVNTVAHRGVLLIMTVQESSDLNKAALRADALLFKPPERMFVETERPRMRIIGGEAIKAFESIPKEQWVKHIFVWVDEERHGLVTYSRPDWMGRKQAKYRRMLASGDSVSNGQGVNQGQDENIIEGEYREISSTSNRQTNDDASFHSPFGDEVDSPLV